MAEETILANRQERVGQTTGTKIKRWLNPETGQLRPVYNKYREARKTTRSTCQNRAKYIKYRWISEHD